MIAFDKSLDINGAWFARKVFDLRGACKSSIDLKWAQKALKTLLVSSDNDTIAPRLASFVSFIKASRSKYL